MKGTGQGRRTVRKYWLVIGGLLPFLECDAIRGDAMRCEALQAFYTDIKIVTKLLEANEKIMLQDIHTNSNISIHINIYTAR